MDLIDPCGFAAQLGASTGRIPRYRAAPPVRPINVGHRRNEVNRVFVAILLIILCGCESELNQRSDPYPGSGGLSMGAPSQKDIDSGKIDFDPERFASFKIGVTTKSEVVRALGKPVAWRTSDNGTSQLEYTYIDPPGPLGMRRVMTTLFTFDAAKVLTRMWYPDYEESGKSK